MASAKGTSLSARDSDRLELDYRTQFKIVACYHDGMIQSENSYVI